MPKAMDAMSNLITEVEASFGDHGEISNPEHPLYRPVQDAKEALREIEQLNSERPVKAEERIIRNPEDLKVIVEHPAGDGRDLQFRFTEKGVTVSVVAVTGTPHVTDERNFPWGQVLTDDGSLALRD